LAEAGGIPMSRVDEVLETVGLKDVAKKGPGKFSLGMSQRLGIAAAILGKPKYLILDEPANGLDPEGIAWLRQFLKEYADAGNAVFVSSHLLSEMSQMADDVVVIGRGKLIAEGSIKDLIAGSAHAGVFVRTTDEVKLKKAFTASQVKYSATEGGFKVTGKTTDQVGQVLFAAKLPVLELSRQDASLEEAFLELTATANEFEAKGGK
jgi:ABC-2 type transport system ATP-binding protein